MSEPQISFAYPVDWPLSRPRTPSRKPALFKSNGRSLLFDDAVGRLREQVSMVTSRGQKWRMRELTLSTNFQLRADGRPRRDSGTPSDPSVAFFFELDGRPHVLACDRWDAIPGNIAAIAAHIEALRGQERWGVADLQQAFAGHAALPAPEQWWQILGVNADATVAEIDAAWRRQIASTHPDQGGSTTAAARINLARDEGRKANG